MDTPIYDALVNGPLYIQQLNGANGTADETRYFRTPELAWESYNSYSRTLIPGETLTLHVRYQGIGERLAICYDPTYDYDYV